MIKSMTGYGKGIAELSTGRLTLEIRTLNGKNCDIKIGRASCRERVSLCV